MDKKKDSGDIFDRIANDEFFALDATDQSEFLDGANLDDFALMQDTIHSAKDFYASEYAALEVPPMPELAVENVVVSKPIVRGTEERTQYGLLRLWDYLNYRIPVYQVAIAASFLIAGIFIFQQQEQHNASSSSFPTLADSTQLLPAAFADTNVMMLPGLLEIVPVEFRDDVE